MPIMSGRVVLKVMDEDMGSSDEAVGSIVLNINDFIDTELDGKIFWKNIYGAPGGFTGKNTDSMNENPEIASTWKGRILIQITANETDKPICMERKIDRESVN
jgi:hypothetical protein